MLGRAAAAVLALCAIAFNSSALLAQAYATYSNSVFAIKPGNKVGLAAARYAARLAPLDAGLQSDLAWSLFASGQSQPARQVMQNALRLAPADADLWLRWSVLQLGCGKCYGDLAAAAQRVNALAPHQDDLQQRQAILALGQWPYGNVATQTAWRQSIVESAGHNSYLLIKNLGPGAISVAACMELGPLIPALAPACHAAN